MFAFDIQTQALESTAARLNRKGLSEQVSLIHRGHEQLLHEIPPSARGHIQAVMFNLGYLPHGDKSRTTCSTTTLPALEQSRQVLAPDGIISVLAYRGHPGGQEEARNVAQKLRQLAGSELQFSHIESPGPILYLLAPNQHD